MDAKNINDEPIFNLEEEYDECNYCDEKILINKMDIANWVNCAYYCDNCIEILKEIEEDENTDFESDSN